MSKPKTPMLDEYARLEKDDGGVAFTHEDAQALIEEIRIHYPILHVTTSTRGGSPVMVQILVPFGYWWDFEVVESSAESSSSADTTFDKLRARGVNVEELQKSPPRGMHVGTPFRDAVDRMLPQHTTDVHEMQLPVGDDPAVVGPTARTPGTFPVEIHGDGSHNATFEDVFTAFEETRSTPAHLRANFEAQALQAGLKRGDSFSYDPTQLPEEALQAGGIDYNEPVEIEPESPVDIPEVTRKRDDHWVEEIMRLVKDLQLTGFKSRHTLLHEDAARVLHRLVAEGRVKETAYGYLPVTDERDYRV